MTVTELRAKLDEAIAHDPAMEVAVRWIDDDCTHVGGVAAAAGDYGCTERQAFILDGDKTVKPPAGYDDVS